MSPWADIAEAVATAIPRDVLRDLLGDGASEIAKLQPQLRHLFLELPPPLTLPPEAERANLFDCFRLFVERLCQSQSVLLVLEDLHWVDHARRNARQKRGSGQQHVSLDETVVVAPGPQPGILALDEALERLAKVDERKARVTELVYFGGLTQAEAGEVIGISLATVERELRQARAWLNRELA